MNMNISEKIVYIGCDDKTLDLFENQYPVPEGVAYNSYLIKDEKIVIMDTCDSRVTDEWLDKLENALDGKIPDYLVVSHLEPDHSGNIGNVMEKYADMKLVCSIKAKSMMGQFFDKDYSERIIAVKEGDTLDLGEHRFKFVMAPMVHWPEVMVTYEETEKVLFSADGFGKFGAIEFESDDWDCEARRYYFNIVGKYGAQVQSLLKKASALDIKCIAPLHGPVLTGNALSHALDRYNTWSSYTPEESGVFIAYATLHGNTGKAAKLLGSKLEEKGIKVVVTDLSRADLAEAVEDAFRYDRMILAAPTYDAGVFTPMEDFIHRLKSKAYQNRRVGFIENGSWAALSAKLMKASFEGMKNISFYDTAVTLKTRLDANSTEKLNMLADEISGQTL